MANATLNLTDIITRTDVDPQDIQPMVYTPMELVALVLITAIFLIGIPGNLFVIYVFGWKQRHRRNRFELLLLILGCIDLVSLLLVPPSFFYLTVTKFRQWHFGKVACKIVPSLLQITVSVSQGMLILICYERYSAIMKPFTNKQISSFRIFAWLCNVIFVSIVFIYPYAYAFELVENDHGVCCQPRGDRLNYLLASSSLQVLRDLMSATTMAILSHRMNKALYADNDVTTWDRAQMTQKSRKVIKTVVIVFTILCLPVDLFHLTYYVLVRQNVNLSHVMDSIIVPINTALNVTQISNSVVNVFIYSKMHVFFRKYVIHTKLQSKTRTCTVIMDGKFELLDPEDI